jgi:peptide/nickel transport system ATP-binding protein
MSALAFDHVTVTYRHRDHLWQRDEHVVAVDDVSFGIGRGSTVGLVGESGSGKTTLTRAALGLVPGATGAVRLDGTLVSPRVHARSRGERRALQIVFQDPMRSLNSWMSVEDIVGEPVRLHFGLRGAARAARVGELLDSVALPSHMRSRRTSELSGGQRQRVALARALAAEPRVLILDEPVTALDVSTQGQVVNLLIELQRERTLSYLLIAHDLTLAAHVSDRMAVMHRGRIVELGPSQRVAAAPSHPYTRDLIEAVPVPDPRVQRSRRVARAARPQIHTMDVASPACAYAPRCDRATSECGAIAPPAHAVGDGFVLCHHPITHDHQEISHGQVLALRQPPDARPGVGHRGDRLHAR